jgi:hypothetical protein
MILIYLLLNNQTSFAKNKQKLLFFLKKTSISSFKHFFYKNEIKNECKPLTISLRIYQLLLENYSYAFYSTNNFALNHFFDLFILVLRHAR